MPNVVWVRDSRGGQLSRVVLHPDRNKSDWELWVLAQQGPSFVRFLRTLSTEHWLNAGIGEISMAYAKIEFLDIRLERSDARKVEKYIADNNDSFDALVLELLDDNNKLSLSPDWENGCVIVAVTCKANKHPNANKCFTSRADTWQEALWLALYKHNVVSKDGVWPDDGPKSSWG